MKKLITSLVVASLMVGAAYAGGKTKFNTSATDAEVVFSPTERGWTIKSISAYGSGNGTIKLYERSGQPKTVGAAPTNGAQTITVQNSSNQFNTNDVVAYVHADGTVDQSTVSSVTTNSITMADGVSQAGSATDKVYELSQMGQQAIVAATQFNVAGDSLYTTVSDSPIWADLQSTNAVLSVTAESR